MPRIATRVHTAVHRNVTPLQLVRHPVRKYQVPVNANVNAQQGPPEMYAARDNFSAATGIRATAVRFTALEERVLRLAASGSERPSTSVEPGLRRLARRVGNAVMARRGGRELADPRLEALRSYAASIALGRTDGLAIFYAAGYTPGHAAAVKRFVAAASRAARAHPHAQRDRVVYASGISIGLASMAAFIGMTGTLLAGY